MPSPVRLAQIAVLSSLALLGCSEAQPKIEPLPPPPPPPGGVDASVPPPPSMDASVSMDASDTSPAPDAGPTEEPPEQQLDELFPGIGDSNTDVESYDVVW